jgi:hypothetical protein
MRYESLIVVSLILAAGCGGPPAPDVVQPADDALESLNEAVSDAIDSIRELAAPAEEGEERSANVSAPALIKVVVQAAEDLTKATPGSPIDTDAQAILSAARRLQEDAAANRSANQLMQGLQDLRAKVAALRARK